MNKKYLCWEYSQQKSEGKEIEARAPWDAAEKFAKKFDEWNHHFADYGGTVFVQDTETREREIMAFSIEVEDNPEYYATLYDRKYQV